MYATNDNLQAIASRNRIRDALFTLMGQYPYKDITITQICQEGQIVRQTFYRNFEAKDDILEFHLDSIIRQYFSNYYAEGDTHIQLLNFYEFMLLNKELLLLILKNNLFFMIDQTITSNITGLLNLRRLSAIEKPGAQKFVIGFIASTICSLLSIWINEEFMHTPKEMSKLTQRFLGGLSAPREAYQ